MGELFQRIRLAVEREQYVVGAHAALRLRHRRIAAWQVAAGTLEGRLRRERPDARPNPVAEVDILLPDGAAANAVWALIRGSDAAKLVTVHFYTR